MRRAGSPQRVDLAAAGPHALRERWRAATLAAGWPFPGDWEAPAVDAVCAAVVDRRDPTQALALLGRARAELGAGLDETLHDLAACYGAMGSVELGVLTSTVVGVDDVPTRLVRAAAVGWADVTSGEVAAAEVIDELTGLTTVAYLRTRLGEVYRGAAAAGCAVGERHALVLLSVDLSRTGGWTRLMPMLLVAEAMRAVYAGGETLALVTPSVAAVLCQRDDRLPLRVKRLRRLTTELLASDRDAASAGPIVVWEERLPADHTAACHLLTRVGRRPHYAR